MSMFRFNRLLLVYVAVSFISFGQTSRESASQTQKQADEFLYFATSSAPGAAPIIKGKPFCANAETETVRVLEDGNRLTRRNVMRVCRDRDGRSRREQTLETLGAPVPLVPRTLIFLYDPIQAISYVVDPPSKVARRFGFPGTSAIRESTPGSSPPAVQTENLGERVIEGLRCAGTRKTTRIAAGSVGNAVPIVSLTETWFAPDIESVVDSLTRDPRLGTVHYRLRQIQRTDPSPNLFKPPGDYTIEAGTSGAR